MIVEIASGKGLIAVGIDGEYVTEKIKGDTGEHLYGLMYATRRACSLLSNRKIGSGVVTFLTTSKQYVKLMNKDLVSGRSDYFDKVMESVNAVPMRYIFSYTKVIQATRHLDGAYIKKKFNSIEELRG